MFILKHSNFPPLSWFLDTATVYNVNFGLQTPCSFITFFYRNLCVFHFLSSQPNCFETHQDWIWNSVAKTWALKIKTRNIFWLCFLPVRLPMGLWLWLHVMILLGPRVYPHLPLLLRCLLVLGLSIDSDIPVIKFLRFHLALELDLAIHTFLTVRLQPTIDPNFLNFIRNKEYNLNLRV